MGAAVGKVIIALVNDLIMPVIGMAIPDGDWRKLTVPVGYSKFLIGDFLGTSVDFVIIAWVVFLITKALIKVEAAPPTKNCPACTEAIPAAARRCKFCTETV